MKVALVLWLGFMCCWSSWQSLFFHRPVHCRDSCCPSLIRAVELWIYPFFHRDFTGTRGELHWKPGSVLPKGLGVRPRPRLAPHLRLLQQRSSCGLGGRVEAPLQGAGEEINSWNLTCHRGTPLHHPVMDDH